MRFFEVPSDALFDDIFITAESILVIVPLQTFAESRQQLYVPLSVVSSTLRYFTTCLTFTQYYTAYLAHLFDWIN